MEKRKVLVIDDYPTMLGLIRYYLERKGCQVFTAASLGEGWQIFEREKPQACSLDLFIGITQDTFTFVRQVRQADKNVVCLAMTRVPIDGNLAKLERLGLHGVFFKKDWEESHDKFFALMAGELKPDNPDETK
jgi:CheY-like chemotaxis protein